MMNRQRHEGRGVPHEPGFSRMDVKLGRALLMLANGVASGIADATRVLLTPQSQRVPVSVSAYPLPAELASLIAAMTATAPAATAPAGEPEPAGSEPEDAVVEAAIADEMAAAAAESEAGKQIDARRLYDAVRFAHRMLERDGAQSGPQREVQDILEAALSGVDRPPVVDQDEPENQQMIDRIKALANALSRAHAVAGRLKTALGDLQPDSMAARWLDELAKALKPESPGATWHDQPEAVEAAT